MIPGDYVFSDPIAFRHLAQEESTEIVQENVVIEGYQVYIVEQWACSRVHPAFVVTTFTGEESNKVLGLSTPRLTLGHCVGTADIDCGRVFRSTETLF